MKAPMHSVLTVMGSLLCGAAGGGAAEGAAASAEPSAEQLLGRWAQALGGAEALGRVQSVHTRSTIETAGLQGTVEDWTTARGQTRQHVVLGEVLDTWNVFDGAAAWERDHNGKVRKLAGTALENAITGSALGSFSHLVAGRMPVRVETAPPKDGALALRLVPQGGREVLVYLDPATGLPQRQDQAESERTRVTSFGDWREVGGIRFPFETRSTVGDPRSDVLVKVLEIKLGEPVDPAAFQKPEEGPPDYRFTQGASALDIPFELSSNHIYVQTRVNGAGPLSLLLDTGAASSVLNATRTEKLGLVGKGKLEGRGAGEGSVDVSVIPGVSFQLPGVEVSGQTIAAVPLDALQPYEGRAIDGILGYDFISRFVVEIDYASRRLRLYEAKSFEYSGSGQVVPITIEDGIVFARATLAPEKGGPFEGKFTIDTGARSALSLTRPFVGKNHVEPSGGRTIRALFGIGVGGETKDLVGRVESVKLGGFTMQRPVTGFSQDAKGAGADPDTAGIIGGEILRRFKVILDYGRERMILEPNVQFDEPYEYDASGVYFVAGGPALDEVRVHRVMEGSPAAEAGLREGDRLVKFGGKPVAEVGLEAVRKRLREPGAEVGLELERDGKPLAVELKLRRLI
jgi:aspartyl protease/PDZ domain-containing protein